MTTAQFKRQQLEKFRNAYKKAKENGTTKALWAVHFSVSFVGEDSIINTHNTIILICKLKDNHNG